MIPRLKLPLILALATLLLGSSANAEPPERRRGKGQFFERVKKMRSKMLRKRVGLDEATAQRVEGILNSFDPSRKSLHKRKRAARKSLRSLIKSDSSDQRAYQSLLDEMQAIQAAMAKLRSDQATALRKELTPKQAAMLLGALLRMKRRMQRRFQGKGGRQGEGGRRGMRRRGRRGGHQRMDHGAPPMDDESAPL